MRSNAYQKTRKVVFVLACITLVSFVVNVWGIKKNLPYAPEVDEKFFWVGRAVMMASTGSANPGWFGHPGSTVLYPMAAIYRLGYGDGAQAAFETSPSRFYILGRLLVIFYATMSIPLIYFIGRKAHGTRTGLIGAWLFVFYPLALSYFQIVRSDSAAVFFGMLGLWRILAVSEKPTWGNQILAGLSIGLSIASRYFMIALIPILLLVDGLAIWKAASKKTSVIVASVGLLAIVLTFAVTTPYFFLDFGVAVDSLRGEARSGHVGADGLSRLGNLRWYLTSAIPTAITWPQFLLAIAGSCIALWKGRMVASLMVGYVLVFLIAISLSALHWSRWLIPILPVLALLAALALDYFSVWISRRASVQLIVLGLCTLAISVWPIYQSILHDFRESNPSTRVLARNWIVENVPSGSHIAQEWYTALLGGTDFVVSEQFALGQGGTLDSYQSSGYDYLIVSDSMYQRFLSEPERYPKEVSFYNTLFGKASLLREFEPTDIQGGPTIRIYELTTSTTN